MFDRAADGTLTQKPGTAGCISDTGAGPCVDGTALDGASSVTVSPDGRSVYVASQIGSAVAVFDRAADGTLTQKPGTAACISETGAGPCVDGTALAVAASVSVSPDGQSAYVASFDSDAVAVLDRAADGGLTQKPGTAGCISEIVLGTCDVGSALDGPRWVTVSPDGRSVYAASVISGAVAVFDREPPPEPGLSVEDLTTDEPAAGSSSRRIVRVYLSAPAPVDVSVDYATADRSATAPGDYTAIAGTLTIPAGRTGGPILVPINGDTLAEGDEQFTVTLSNPRNATIARAAATVTILRLRAARHDHHLRSRQRRDRGRGADVRVPGGDADPVVLRVQRDLAWPGRDRLPPLQLTADPRAAGALAAEPGAIRGPCGRFPRQRRPDPGRARHHLPAAAPGPERRRDGDHPGRPATRLRHERRMPARHHEPGLLRPRARPQSRAPVSGPHAGRSVPGPRRARDTRARPASRSSCGRTSATGATPRWRGARSCGSSGSTATAGRSARPGTERHPRRSACTRAPAPPAPVLRGARRRPTARTPPPPIRSRCPVTGPGTGRCGCVRSSRPSQAGHLRPAARRQRARGVRHPVHAAHDGPAQAGLS